MHGTPGARLVVGIVEVARDLQATWDHRLQVAEAEKREALSALKEVRALGGRADLPDAHYL